MRVSTANNNIQIFSFLLLLRISYQLYRVYKHHSTVRSKFDAHMIHVAKILIGKNQIINYVDYIKCKANCNFYTNSNFKIFYVSDNKLFP